MSSQPALFEPPPTPVDQAFEAFWRAYPRRVPNPRQPALEAFTRLVRREGVAAARLVEAARLYALQVERDQVPEMYVPHARTWLRQRRFEEYEGQGAGGRGQGTGGVPEPSGWLWERLRGLVDPVLFRLWLAPLAIERSPGRAVVRAPSTVHLQQARARFDWALRVALGDGRIEWEVGDG